MLRINLFRLLVVLGVGVLLGGSAVAQDAGASAKPSAQTETSSDEKPAAQREKEKVPLDTYHLAFLLAELEDGKKINTREYSTTVTTNEGNEIKIGTRVPVEAKEGEFQYLDIGTNIFARISESRGQTELNVRAEISNFAGPEEQDKPDTHPIIRQVKMTGSTELPLSKSIVIASADEPNSKRQFQLEVTATKVK
jgi:hypothetical protein